VLPFGIRWGFRTDKEPSTTTTTTKEAEKQRKEAEKAESWQQGW
jgi:hypothetical protein